LHGLHKYFAATFGDFLLGINPNEKIA